MLFISMTCVTKTLHLSVADHSLYWQPQGPALMANWASNAAMSLDSLTLRLA